MTALCAALTLSPVLLAQSPKQKARTGAFDPHDLMGIWSGAAGNAAVGVPCHIGGQPTDPPDPKCAVPANPPTGNPEIKGGGDNVLPTGVEMTPWAHARWMSQDQGTGISGTADPYDHCDPPGTPRALFGFIHPFEIVQVPGKTWMIYEEAHFWRLIYTDGRPIPKVADLPFGPTYLGYSVGHWDKDTFVVDTIGLNDKTWIDDRGHVQSEEMHMTDVYRRVNPDILEVSFSFDDPQAYTKSWTYGPKKYERKTGKEWEMQESYCTLDEQRRFNQQITDPTGQGTVQPRAN
jgi:hypothetical protein